MAMRLMRWQTTDEVQKYVKKKRKTKLTEQVRKYICLIVKGPYKNSQHVRVYNNLIVNLTTFKIAQPLGV